jgi:hypothetical protein
MRPPPRTLHLTPCTSRLQRRDADTCVLTEDDDLPFCGGSAVAQHGQSASLAQLLGPAPWLGALGWGPLAGGPWLGALGWGPLAGGPWLGARLGARASSGQLSRLLCLLRALLARLWAAWHSQGEAGPLGAQPLPRVLERAASKAAHFTTL